MISSSLAVGRVPSYSISPDVRIVIRLAELLDAICLKVEASSQSTTDDDPLVIFLIIILSSELS